MSLRSIRVLRSSYSAMSSTRGVPIEFIRGSRNTFNFPLVRPGRQHTVLYYLPNEGPPTEYPPKPLAGEDKWDYEHVRLPCSIRSKYPIEQDLDVEDRWPMIISALNSPIRDSKQLAEAILKYNHSYRMIWKFTTLHALFENLDEDESEKFFDISLPAIVKLALDLPKLIQSPIPLLKKGMNHSITMSQQQIACLLANAFFCTFPRRNSRSQKEYGSYPYINFTSLYESEPSQPSLEKLKCLIRYLVRVTQHTPRGVVTFCRRSVPGQSCPRWERSGAPLSRVPLHVDPNGFIERADGLIQLDFANKYLGGGVLGHGCVQEEIRFVTCPELMASMLFTQALADTEALVIIGAERYNQYLGYGNTFEWANAYTDDAPIDHSGRKSVTLLAIDALPFRNFADQYKKKNIDRELNKAWVGFSAYSVDQHGDNMNFPGVATGNWGCGAFRGFPPLKSLIQLMACAEARRPMAYFTFKDQKFGDELLDMYERLCRHNVTVGQLYKYILRFASSDAPKTHLFEYLRQVLQDESRSKHARAPGATTSLDPAEQVTPRHQENVPRSDSPDLFSQDEEQNQETNKVNHPKKHGHQNLLIIENKHDATNNSDIKRTDSNKDYEITDSDAQIFDSFFDTSDSDLKTSDDSKVIDRDSKKITDSPVRLSESSISIADNVSTSHVKSTKMSDTDIRNFVNYTKVSNKNCDNVKMTKNEVKITIEDSEDDANVTKVKESSDSKNADNTSPSNQTLLLFEEMQKFDDENGKLNISVTKISSAAKNKRIMSALNDSDAMESDEKVLPPEQKKKKLSSKITDYFKSHLI